MAKKKSTRKTSKKKFIHVPITPKEYLETLIKFSERAIVGPNGSTYDYFVSQTERLKKELEELKSK